jgi:DNA polymerase (family 10)
MKNREIAEMFERMADVLEFQGEMPFKVNAYRKASRVLQDLDQDIEEIWRAGELEKIPGIGSGLAKKIDEYLRTGRMTKYEEVVSQVPSELIDLMQIPNLGPKTLAMAHKHLGVRDLDSLKKVIADGSLAGLPGMGEKKVQNILRGIQLFEQSQARISIGEAYPIVEQIIGQLKSHPAVLKISPAGSLRRMKETVGDIDILVATERGREVIQEFVRLPQVQDILAAGETKGSVLVQGGRQVDLRAVAPDSFGAALQYFTGSKAHNVHLRDLAKRDGLKINEYGIFRGEEKLGGKEEEEIYHILGMDWIPPEMREDRGEIDLALQHALPRLITLQDIRGDLHVHSRYSDGHSSIPELVEAAKERGYEYIGVCDHSQSVKYAQGLTPEKLLEKVEEIRRLNEGLNGFQVLAGAEVDILGDGQLDYPDEVLAELDIVIAAIHQGFKQNVTERILAAMRNPHVLIVAHPTGRLLSGREGYEVDVEAVLRGAAETGTVLEINAYYDRLDLDDAHARRAAELGVLLAINTDAHLIDHLKMMLYGVGVARRAWLSPEKVINTWPVQKILELRKRKQQRLAG